MDYAALAKQLGGMEATAPQPAQSNWMDGLSPKDRADLQVKQYEEGRKRIAELDAEIAKGESIMGDLNRFGELNRQSRTGGFWDNVLPSVPLLHGADENEMYAIQARLGPSQRAPGSGASSDRDVSLFLSGLPRVENTGPVNKNIREEFRRKYDSAVSKKQAMQDYLERNGNLNGFDTEWAQRKTAKQPQAQASSPKSKSFKIDGGGSVIGTLGADGYYYVKRGGKNYRIEE